MSKDFAWEFFKKTGNLDTFMIMRNVENDAEIQEINTSNTSALGDINGNIEN